MKNVKLKFKKLRPDAITPVKEHEAAGHDLFACLNEDCIEIPPHTTKKIPTGIAVQLPIDIKVKTFIDEELASNYGLSIDQLEMELPLGLFGGIYAKSGRATKEGLAPANKVGVCDCDYRGEYIVAIHNHTDEPRIIKNHEKIAQLIIMVYLKYELEETTDDLDETDRGAGGFGSTGLTK